VVRDRFRTDRLAFGVDDILGCLAQALRYRGAVALKLPQDGVAARFGVRHQLIDLLQRLDFEKNDAMMHAAGGIVTTPADLVRWLEANIDDGKIGSSQAIDPAAFRDAHRKQVDVKAERGRFRAYGYGLGWYQARLDDHEVLFHLGGFPGWQTHVSFMPEARIGVAVVTNASGPALPLIDFIAASIYDRLLDKPEAGAAYDRGLAELKTALDHGRARYAAAVQERAKRPWMLRHPNAAYAGVYENPDWGTLRIEQRDGKLVASLAHLSSVLEAFTQPETARIELVPGNGDVLRFTFGDGDTADTVHMGKLVFQRVQ